MKADRFIAKIDSCSTMLLAAANFLRGRDVAGLGFVPLSKTLAKLVNLPPKRLRQYVYILGGWREAVPPSQLRFLRGEEISKWVVRFYPRRQYPAVMIGSSNGALIHLCAALGIPWLPQTVLIPIRRSKALPPDELRKDMEAFRGPARRMLEANPELQVNQMHDPVQDRLMVQRMGYFRVKRLQLGETYERFLRSRLAPGGTILVADCSYSWPMTRVGPRHFFQVGGYGGLTAKEYLQGSSRRIADFLKQQKSKTRGWNTPKPDGTRPEAEWGFEPALMEDLERLAQRRGYRIRRISFRQPDNASPFVADLYRWWYKQNGISTSRILAESFLLLDPWWCLRTGSIPFWLVFNTASSERDLRRYIQREGPFDEIYLTLFANSVKGINQTTLRSWKSILRKARRKNGFLGIDEASYPYDLGVYFRFHLDLQDQMKQRLPLPKSLTVTRVERFFREHSRQYSVQWLKS
ncbi:MAG: hypothetical protein HYZ88_00295 [Candidatus Omnitrophica bacterium]|nr:hypothetical protein [Candidatus Omnitrophota bacterium]